MISESFAGLDSLVIVPTYNEVENLEPLARQVLQQGPFDLLIIDDHSPDGTGKLADAIADRSAGRVQVIHRSSKLGLGTAYLTGFARAREAGYERIFQMDADFSHDPAYLPTLRRTLDRADVVLGSRYTQGGGVRHWPIQRLVVSRLGSEYARMVLGLPIRDLTGGYKGFRRRALLSLDLDTIRSNGYSFQIEVTYLCHRRGLQISEVPIVFEDRRQGQSKMSWPIIAEAMFLVWRLRFQHADRVSPLAAAEGRQDSRVAGPALVVPTAEPKSDPAIEPGQKEGEI